MSRGELIAQQRWLEALYVRQQVLFQFRRDCPDAACAEAVSSLCLSLAQQDLGLEPIPEPELKP